MSIESKLNESKTKLETALSDINDALEEKGGEPSETVAGVAEKINELSGAKKSCISHAVSRDGNSAMQLSNGSWFYPVTAYAHGALRTAWNTNLFVDLSAVRGNFRRVIKFKWFGHESSLWGNLFGPEYYGIIWFSNTSNYVACPTGTFFTELSSNTWYYIAVNYDFANSIAVGALYNESGVLLEANFAENQSYASRTANMIIGGTGEGDNNIFNGEIELCETFIEVDNEIIWGEANSKTADMGKVDPEEYFSEHFQQVEYIESTNNESINTKITATPLTRIVADYQFVQAGLQARVFSTRTTKSTYSTYDVYINGSGKYAYAHSDGQGNWVTTNVSADTQRHIFDYDAKSGTFEIDNGSVVSAVMEGTLSHNSEFPVYIFGDSEHQTNARLYSFKIYNDDVLVSDLVPCYNKASGTIGLLDKEGFKFYGNAGTGAFIKGADIN